MYAIIETGGKQYKISEGDKVRVEKLSKEVGEKVVFENVLMASQGDNTLIGTPYVSDASVTAEVTDQGKAKKVVVFKYKPKKGERKKNGHRQLFTELEIMDISFPGKVDEPKPEKEEKPKKKKAAKKAEKPAKEVAEEAKEEAAEEAVETAEEVAEEVAEEAAVETAEEVTEETSEEAAEEKEEAAEE